jgi:Sec-independent protein translocase protein TatA
MGEITVILLLALIFLGPAKLPDLATGLGKLIREIRKATNDIKSEITLDDSFRKPFEELRDAVMLHPDELKRRDQIKKMVEEARLRDEAEAREAAAAAALAAGSETAVPPAITSTVPRSISGAPDAPLLDADPLPPIPPSILHPVAPPPGTVARFRPAPAAGAGEADPGELGSPAEIMTSAPSPSPLPGPPRVLPPTSSLEGDRANRTQSLSEADLLPSTQPRQRKPTPPPLPGLEKRAAARAPDAAAAPISLASLVQSGRSATSARSAESGEPARAATPSPPIGHLGPPRVTPPVSSQSGPNANVTQVLSESDLLPPPAAPPLPADAAKPPPLPGSKKT